MNTARSVAVKVLCDIVRNGSYSNIAGNIAINESGLERKDAALSSLLIYGVLQRMITLDFVISKFAEKGIGKIHPQVLNALRIGAYQLLFMDRVPESAAVNESVTIIKKSKQNFASGFANAVLRKIASSKKQLLDEINNAEMSIKYSCPKDVCEELTSDYSEETACLFLQASLETPEIYARVNTLKIAPEELFNLLREKDINCDEKAPYGSFIIKKAGNIEALQEFKDGLFYVQDNASQIALADFGIKPGMDVLDICSAPGGKSFTAAMLLDKKGSITSCDLYEKRVGLISSGAKRLGINNLKALQNDASVFNDKLGMFDAVICDVPCSGLGVIRRKPEIKYRSLDQYNELFEIQSKILKVSSQYVKNGGRLMYSTCTVRKAENSNVVNAFLSKNSNYKIIAENTLMPQSHGTDGFYYCVLERM